MPPWGSRTNFATKVTINVYDLTPMNDWGHPFGLGAFHSGVEIDGREYTFAGGAGIHDTTPRDAPGATFREAVAVGTFDGGQPRLRECLEKLRPEFAPESYNIVTKNCNHFADALCRELLSARAPGYINRLAACGSCLAPCLPPESLTNAPVDAAAPSGSRLGAWTGRAGAGHGAGAFTAFKGAGNSLGGDAAAAAAAAAPGSSVEMERPAERPLLEDRRERIRAATLARLGGSGAN